MGAVMNTLKCDCGGIFVLKKDVYKYNKGGKEYRFHNCNVLECVGCNNQEVFYTANQLCEVVVEDVVKKKIEHYDYDFEKIKSTFLKDDYISTDVDFIYDKDDYYFFPGLIRPWNTGFLTPVFFNIEVLLKYAYHPSYALELGANTLGSLYKNQKHMIQFGINPNGKVIMWLGDIGKLELEEQHYLRSENIQSDHNIYSEFYEAEIESVWADPSNEKKLLKNRMLFHEMALTQLNVSIAQLEPETIRIASKIKRPLFSSEDAFAEVIIPMNMLFVESINNKSLKSNLKQFENIDLKDKKGLKLLELWLTNVLKIQDASKVISPLFVLYDLRIAMAHLQTEERKEELISFGCERLGLNKDERDYLIIFDKLIEALNEMYCNMINSFNNIEEN